MTPHAASTLLMVPSSAEAHGLTGDAATVGVLGMVPLGIEHMLLGWDHILFIGGVVLLAGHWRRAAKLISVFLAGHSLTLITATLAGWRVNPTLVDVVIVLSVVFVGGYGMVGRPRRWDLFGAAVFGFGLVHGLGLATRLQALGVPDDNLLWRVIAFNVGIEIGQLTAIVAVLAVAAVASMAFGRRREPALLKAAFAGLFLVGTVAAPLLAYRGFAGGGGTSDVAVPQDSGCTIADRAETFPAAGGVHTAKRFYEPGDVVPLNDFGHALGDGYVIVLYPPGSAGSDVVALRSLVTSAELRGVLAGPHSGRSRSVKVITSDRTMTCPTVHIGAIRQFSSAWLAPERTSA